MHPATASTGRLLWRLSVNDFIIKALGAGAAESVPAANVTWARTTAILQHRVSDVGVAVAVEGGLVHAGCAQFRREQVAERRSRMEMKELAGKARARQA
jgi:pyruvate/2-oxoglutarate dehydrogenase complex dihydrolipoamide acyltransferase (E2) component